jgi:hypothetical protein
MEGKLRSSSLEEVLGIRSALGGADCYKDLSPRRAIDCRRRSGRLTRGTSCSLHHLEPLGGKLQEGLRQSDDAVHRGTGDPLPKAGGLGI